MKKLLLASAIAALSVSAAHAAPTVYGKALVTVDYEDIDVRYGKDKDSVQINSHSSRIGFKGSEPMTANTDVIYQLEYGIDIDGDDDRTLRARDTYLGFNNTSFGEFRFGRNQSSTDRINNVVVAGDGYWDTLGSEHQMLDSARIDNTLLWTAPKFSGVPLEFSAMYAADEEDVGNKGWGAALMLDQGTGYTVGISYEKDLNIGHAYDEVLSYVNNPTANNTNWVYNVNDADMRQGGKLIRATATVDLSSFTSSALPLTLGALYQSADYDYAGSKKEKGYVISAEYALSNFNKPIAIYAQYNNTSDLRGLNGVDSDQIVLGGKYFFKPNMIWHAYAGYSDSDLEYLSDSIVTKGSTETLAVGTGLEYKF